jgi:hypothetical protein
MEPALRLKHLLVRLLGSVLVELLKRRPLPTMMMMMGRRLMVPADADAVQRRRPKASDKH